MHVTDYAEFPLTLSHPIPYLSASAVCFAVYVQIGVCVYCVYLEPVLLPLIVHQCITY